MRPDSREERYELGCLREDVDVVVGDFDGDGGLGLGAFASDVGADALCGSFGFGSHCDYLLGGT